MTLATDAVEASVIQALRRPELSAIRFTCGSTRVSPEGFADIACMIARGIITLSSDNPGRGSACYQATHREGAEATDTDDAELELFPDTLYLGSATFDVDRPLKRSLLLHEATHAIQDMANVTGGMTVGEAEAAAYVTTAFGFIAYGTTWAGEAAIEARAGRARTPHLAELAEVAHAVAKRIHRNPSASEVTPAERRNLIEHIGRLRAYAGTISSSHDFDGIGTRA